MVPALLFVTVGVLGERVSKESRSHGNLISGSLPEVQEGLNNISGARWLVTVLLCCHWLSPLSSVFLFGASVFYFLSSKGT